MKKGKKKYWIFYIMKDCESMDVEKYGIYAFTDNSELAYQFINTRNMNLFYVKTIKLDNKEWNELLKHNLHAELSMLEGTTKNKNYKVVPFCVPVTKREKMFCNNDETIYIHEYLYRFLWESIIPYKDKYINALDTLLYSDLSELLKSNGDMDVYQRANERLIPDHFNILMRHVKDLFIESEFLEERSDL